MIQKRQHGTVTAVGVMLLAALLAGSAAADTLTVNGVRMRNVLVTGYAANVLFVRQSGQTINIPIDTVQQMEIGGEDELNRAEALAAKGDKGMVAAYEAAAKKARGTWRPALVKKRLEMAQAGAFPIPVKKQAPPPPPKPEPKPQPKPAPKPEPKPEPAPEPKPDEVVKLPPGADDTTRALASQRNLYEACKSLPTDPKQSVQWSHWEDAQRRQALQKYEDDTKKWNARYGVRGKPVTWTLTVTSVAKRNGRIVVGARDGEQIVVDATFTEAFSQNPPPFKAGEKIRVTGTLRNFIFKHGEKTIFIDDASHLSVFLSEATLADEKK
jgi:hypothetical protein